MNDSISSIESHFLQSKDLSETSHHQTSSKSKSKSDLLSVSGNLLKISINKPSKSLSRPQTPLKTLPPLSKSQSTTSTTTPTSPSFHFKEFSLSGPIIKDRRLHSRQKVNQSQITHCFPSKFESHIEEDDINQVLSSSSLFSVSNSLGQSYSPRSQCYPLPPKMAAFSGGSYFSKGKPSTTHSSSTSSLLPSGSSLIYMRQSSSPAFLKGFHYEIPPNTKDIENTTSAIYSSSATSSSPQTPIIQGGALEDEEVRTEIRLTKGTILENKSYDDEIDLQSNIKSLSKIQSGDSHLVFDDSKPGSASSAMEHDTIKRATSKGVQKFVSAVPSQTREYEENNELPYQVHRRVLGWKLTSLKRKKEMINVLDNLNNYLPSNSRGNDALKSTIPLLATDYQNNASSSPDISSPNHIDSYTKSLLDEDRRIENEDYHVDFSQIALLGDLNHPSNAPKTLPEQIRYIIQSQAVANRQTASIEKYAKRMKKVREKKGFLLNSPSEEILKHKNFTQRIASPERNPPSSSGSISPTPEFSSTPYGFSSQINSTSPYLSPSHSSPSLRPKYFQKFDSPQDFEGNEKRNQHNPYNPSLFSAIGPLPDVNHSLSLSDYFIESLHQTDQEIANERKIEKEAMRLYKNPSKAIERLYKVSHELFNPLSRSDRLTLIGTAKESIPQNIIKPKVFSSEGGTVEEMYYPYYQNNFTYEQSIPNYSNLHYGENQMYLMDQQQQLQQQKEENLEKKFNEDLTDDENPIENSNEVYSNNQETKDIEEEQNKEKNEVITEGNGLAFNDDEDLPDDSSLSPPRLPHFGHSQSLLPTFTSPVHEPIPHPNYRK